LNCPIWALDWRSTLKRRQEVNMITAARFQLMALVAACVFISAILLGAL
jgi:hypothetical protein